MSDGKTTMPDFSKDDHLADRGPASIDTKVRWKEKKQRSL